MGWTFECTPSRLKDFLRRRAEGWDWIEKETGIRHAAKCLAHKYVMKSPGSGTLWKVMETSRYDKDGNMMPDFPQKWIGCDLIKWGGGSQAGWGYKDMEEHSGPGEISCPLSYLDMVPEPAGHAQRCDKSQYGPQACACGACHGCGECYAAGWRKNVREGHAMAKARKRFLNSLRVGDKIVLSKRVVGAGTVLDVRQLKPLVAGYYKIRPKDVDVAASIAASTGVELEVK